MPDPKTKNRFKGLDLSAVELRQERPEWSDSFIEDYLNRLENEVILADLIDIEIDQKLEQVPTDFTDGSIPFVDTGFLVEDNINLAWSTLLQTLAAKNVLTDNVMLNLTAGITPAEGELTWNDDDGALNIGMPGGNVIAQIPLESLARVVNKSGSDIANGKFVYVMGSQGNRDTIELADKTDVNTVFVLGMTTEDINNNANGYVARFGYVRGSATEPIDTSGTVAGDPVYLSTAGGFTVTHPTSSTDAVVIVGNINRVHATEGVFSLQPPKSFTIGNEFNGTIRQGVINKGAGTLGASGFTAVNDNGHFTTVGIAGSGNLIFPNEVSVHYAPGYGDHWQAVDGAKDYVWFTDPTDSHNNSSLSNEVMRLATDGQLSLNGIFNLPKASTSGIKVDLAAPTFGFADIIGDQFSRNTGATKPLLAAYNGAVNAWQFANGDEAYISFHIPHDYVKGTDIFLHIHWSQNNAGATGGTVDFRYTAIYAKGHNQASGSTFTATPKTALFSSIDINDGASGLNQYQQHLTEAVVSAATATAALFDRDDIEPDGVIELTFEMDATNLTGTPSLPFVHFVDIHYQTTGLIGTKQKAPDFYT